MWNAHTPDYLPFARDGETLRMLVDAALAESGAHLVQRRIPAGTPPAQAIVEASRRVGMVTYVEPGIVSPRVEVRGDFDGYVARLSKKTRNDARRCRRLLDAAGRAEFRAIAAPVDLETELSRGFAVEGSGWKAERGTAILGSPETEIFYRSVCRRFHALGKVGISTLELDGRPIAFSLNLVDFGRAWGLKGGYEREFARYSPGILLAMAEIEHCSAYGLASLEMLGDEAAWKRKFAWGERRHLVVHSYRRRPGRWPAMRTRGCCGRAYGRSPAGSSPTASADSYGTRRRSARGTISNRTGVVPGCSPSSWIGSGSSASTATSAPRSSSAFGWGRCVPR